MIKTLWLTLVILIFELPSFSQNTFSITGVVKDAKETLPGAGIYIAGYKIATVTNNEGKFIIPNLRPGNYDILVQMIGYIPLSKNVIISDKSTVVEIKLIEKTTLLNEVVIKPDPDREWLINLFKEFFIGKTPNAAQCKILNTNILDIDHDKRSRILIVKASDFLIIENQALGYRIKYLLEQFEYNFNTKILFYAGYPTFEDMKGSNAKQKRWLKNREVAYKGSAQHFFTSLYQNRVDEEGFIINKRCEIPNKNRLPDSLIEASITQLMTGKYVAQLTVDNKNTNSINYWLKERRKPKVSLYIDRNKIYTDTLVKIFNNNFKMINFKDDLFVFYKNEKESADYEKSSYYQSRPVDLVGQVSVMKMLRAPIYFYPNGVVYNPSSTLYSGYWSYEKMADTVPMDYIVANMKQ
jgi:hypothetical protein